jgi:hypothetical protein
LLQLQTKQANQDTQPHLRYLIQEDVKSQKSISTTPKSP